MGKRAYIRFKAGDRFERVLVIGLIGEYAICRCDCGIEKKIRKDSLRSGAIKSCGCLHREIASCTSKTHGMTHTRTYQTWDAMIQRCTNKNHKHYMKYGGRGITICKRWRNSFEDFLTDMGARPKGKTIDRKDVNGNYEPSNCQWATQSEQNLNRRKKSVWIVNGEKFFTLNNAASSVGVCPQTILNWCAGYVSKQGRNVPPKDGCSVERVLGFA